MNFDLKKMSTKRKILKKYYSTGWNDRIWPKNDDSTKESFPLTYFHRKVALICLKQNSGDKKKWPRNKNKKKSHFGVRNNKIWPKNDEPLMESSVDPFPIEKLHQFVRIWILVQKKKKNSAPKKKFSKKMSFRRPKRWNFAETRWTYDGVLAVDPFPIEKLHKNARTWILTQKKKSTEMKFFKKKNAISEVETMEFARKTMNILWSLARWPISNQKAAQICTNLNSGTKKKRASKWKFSKNCHLGGRNDRIWPKNDEHPMESCLLTHFKSKSIINLRDSKL